MAHLQQSLLQRSSASDSNLRCHEGEWFRLQRPWRLRGPLPIPFSAAAKENGSACNGRGGYEVRVRFHSSLPRRRMVPPAERHYPTDASILDFEARLGNHCMVFPGTIPKTASILDFKLRLGNRCSDFDAAAKISPPAAQSWGAGRGRVPRRRHNPK